MGPEIVTMLGVGVAVAAFCWRVMADVEQRLHRRFDRLENKVDDLSRAYRTLSGEIAELRERMARGGRPVRGIHPQGAAGRGPGGGINAPYSAATALPRAVSRSTSSR